MGIWDSIKSTSDALKRNAPDLTPVKDAYRTSYDYGSAAVNKIDNAVRTNIPYEETRAMMVSFATKLAKNTADYVANESFKSIPGVTAASKIVSKTINDVKSENHNNQEMKAMQKNKGGPKEDFNGGAKEGLKDQSPSHLSNEKRDLTLVMEEMQAKLEKMHEDMNNIKQQNTTSTQCVDGIEPLKELPIEPTKESIHPKTDAKRVFIRSRL